MKKLNINNNEIEYIKNKLLNDKLGLVLNYDEIDEVLDNNYFGLEEKQELHINPKAENNNLIIEGDNYYGLKALKVSGIKVDIIYIDPPYNTGNKDFIYNDDFSTKVAKEVNTDDPHKHSKWLSFMKKRLEIAKDLLTDDGVIFVSIDDNEQAYLKVLMDEIFGEENFVSNLIVELTKTQGMKIGSAKKGSVVKGYENILFYTKIKRSEIVKKILYDKSDTKYDTHYNQYWNGESNKFISITEWLKNNKFAANLFQKYRLNVSPKNINTLMNISKDFNDFILKNGKFIFHLRNIDLENIQNLNIEVDRIIKYEKYLLFKKNHESKIQQLQSMSMSIHETNDYISELCRSNIRGNLWKNFDKDLSNLDKEGSVDFKNGKKPTRLIKQLIEWISKNNELLILDFFAGSGTTGQAVMELNEEDNGSRRFILITNNENNIARNICRERIHRVILGKGSNNETIAWEYSEDKKSLFNNSVKYLIVKPIHQENGEYEDINKMKDIYKNEFNKILSIKDFI